MRPARAASWAWLAAVMVAAAASHALSLRSTRAEAFLGELRPGSKAAWSKALGEPLGIENTGGEPIVVEVSFESPPPGRLADGYEALPDPGWAKASVPRHALDPGKKGQTEIVVLVPSDPALEGRQFQLDCALTGRSPGGSALKLTTRLLLAVGAGDAPEVRKGAPEGFVLSPPRGRARDVPLGRRHPLLAGDGVMKLANAGARDLTVRLSVLRAWPQGMDPPEGFAPAPNPRWLKTGPPVQVRAGTVGTAALELLVPDEPRYGGRRWSFLVAADAAIGRRSAASESRQDAADAHGGGLAGRSYFVLSVETMKAK